MASITCGTSKGYVNVTLNVWENSVDTARNVSNVGWNVVITDGSWGTSWTGWGTAIYTTVVIDYMGTQIVYVPEYDYGGRHKPGSVFGEGSFEVEHAQDGSRALNFSISFTDGAGASYTPGSGGPVYGSITLTKIARYFTTTPKIEVSSKTDNSMLFKWTTSETCSKIVWSDGTTQNVNATSGTYEVKNLNYNTAYPLKGTFTRKDSNLSSESNQLNEKTYNYPYVERLEKTTIKVGETQTAYLYNPNGRTVTFYAKYNNANGELLYQTTTNEKTVSQITFNSNKIYQLMANNGSIKIYYYCVYNDTVIQGMDGYIEILGTERPVFTDSQWSYTANLTSLTNDNSIIIANYSTISVSINSQATSSYYADIDHYIVSCGNLNITGNYGSTITIPNAPSSTISVIAVDKRGISSDSNTSTKTLVDKYISYNSPSITKSTTDRNNGIEETVTLTANGRYTGGTFGENGVTNALIKPVYYTQSSSDSSWNGPYEISLDKVSYPSAGNWRISNANIHYNGTSGGFTGGETFTVKLIVKDAQGLLGSTEMVSTVSSGKIARDVYKDSNNEYHEGINGLASQSYTQTIHGSININGDIYKNGTIFNPSTDISNCTKSQPIISTTIPNMINTLRVTTGGRMGSAYISEYKYNDYIKIPLSWYNYIWLPHNNGGTSGDSSQYGTLLLYGMTTNQLLWRIRYSGQAIASVTNACLDSYPVGAIYLSANGKSPASLFGGSWTQLQGRYLYASGTTATDTSTAQGKDNMSTYTGTGAQKYTLSANQSGLRQHNHTYGQGYPNRAYDGSSHGTSADWGGAYNTNNQGPWSAAEGHPHDVSYIAMYVWQRTA